MPPPGSPSAFTRCLLPSAFEGESGYIPVKRREHGIKNLVSVTVECERVILSKPSTCEPVSLDQLRQAQGWLPLMAPGLYLLTKLVVPDAILPQIQSALKLSIGQVSVCDLSKIYLT